MDARVSAQWRIPLPLSAIRGSIAEVGACLIGEGEALETTLVSFGAPDGIFRAAAVEPDCGERSFAGQFPPCDFGIGTAVRANQCDGQNYHRHETWRFPRLPGFPSFPPHGSWREYSVVGAELAYSRSFTLSFFKFAAWIRAVTQPNRRVGDSASPERGQIGGGESGALALPLRTSNSASYASS